MNKTFSLAVSFVLSASVLVSPLRADIVSGKTEKDVAQESGAAQAVAAQIAASGASADAAAAVVQEMPPAEMAYFGSKVERVQPAGSLLVTILIVAAVVILVLYLTDNLK